MCVHGVQRGFVRIHENAGLEMQLLRTEMPQDEIFSGFQVEMLAGACWLGMGMTDARP
jgi:hypothetical protein